MYIFLNQEMKYHVITEPTNKHALLVGPTDKEMDAYTEKTGLKTNKELKKYMVLESRDQKQFYLFYPSLIHRLAPFLPFDTLFKYFSVSKKNETMRLVVEAYYFGDGNNSPFIEYDPEKHGEAFTMETPHA